MNLRRTLILGLLIVALGGLVPGLFGYVEERYTRKWVGIHPYDVVLVRTPYALMMTGHMAHGGARRQGACRGPRPSHDSSASFAG